jgi:hypothetical protein
MNNLLALHTGHATDLLELLWLLKDQLLQMLDRMLQLCRLRLTPLELLVPLMQLGLEVVDIALGSGQLILSVLLSGAGNIEEV